MLHRHGFTLIEIVVVLTIIGVVTVFAIPNFTLPAERARALNTQNNLLTIYGAEKNYINNNGVFVAGATLAVLNTALFLNIQDDGTYTYSCVLTGPPSGFTCTATRGVFTITVTNAPILIHVAGPNPVCSSTAWCP